MNYQAQSFLKGWDAIKTRVAAMAHVRRLLLGAFRAVDRGALTKWDRVLMIDADLASDAAVIPWDDEMLYLTLGRDGGGVWRDRKVGVEGAGSERKGKDAGVDPTQDAELGGVQRPTVEFKVE